MGPPGGLDVEFCIVLGLAGSADEARDFVQPRLLILGHQLGAGGVPLAAVVTVKAGSNAVLTGGGGGVAQKATGFPELPR